MLAIELHIPPGQTNRYKLLNFYVNKLDFSVQADSDDPSIEYFTFGDLCLHMYTRQKPAPHPYFGYVAKSTILGRGVEIVNIVGPDFDLHAYWESIQKKLHPKSITQVLKQRHIVSSTDSPILYHDFRLCDPFGYYLRFSENPKYECNVHSPNE